MVCRKRLLLKKSSVFEEMYMFYQTRVRLDVDEMFEAMLHISQKDAESARTPSDAIGVGYHVFKAFLLNVAFVSLHAKHPLVQKYRALLERVDAEIESASRKEEKREESASSSTQSASSPSASASAWAAHRKERSRTTETRARLTVVFVVFIVRLHQAHFRFRFRFRFGLRLRKRSRCSLRSRNRRVRPARSA